MNVACHWFKCQMVAKCPHFWTSQCEIQTTRRKDKQRFYTKANLSAYMRSCSCTGRLIDSDPLIFSKCHYAPMHMLILGHVKSDIYMVSK